MILLDTCAIVWDALDRDRLTDKAKLAIARADENRALIISPEIAELSVNFGTDINSDPADRIIAASL
ncbi:hypothetical protein [Ectothiorhodospira sp. BSL-9]|uniref:hypothetical protein n=1 Tax=Ectothiorhodospira sp. BSL-9 TaxID=1442136 RepID=UPI001969C346|nr:hypothetical protein [Ectothiorhodospira sp. BSL-9]